MFELQVKDESLSSVLGRVAGRMAAPRDLMRMIAGTLETETEKNFEAQGRPRWLGLSPMTIALRTKAGTWPGKILQISAGGLAASVTTDYGNDYAAVGSNKPYAAIQHLGGKAGRGRKVTIPARPYFPADASGNLQPEARLAIIHDVRVYFASLVKP